MDIVLRALVDPHRRQILDLVREQELPAGAIARHFRITRPAVSQHLTVLKQAGLVRERREGTKRLYRADPGAFISLQAYLDDFWDSRLTALKEEAEARHRPLRTREAISVEREIVIGAPREIVWRLLVDPNAATRWMGVSASFDLRVGGRYRVEVLPGVVAAGEFVQIDAPRRLVHTWGWELAHDGPVPPGSTIVRYELRRDGDATRLRLGHRDLPGIDTAGSHARGWAHYLDRLAAAAEDRSPGPDPWVADPQRMRDELRPASSGSAPPRQSREEFQ